MSADDAVRQLAAEVVAQALDTVFPRSDLAGLAQAARLLGIPAVYDALTGAQEAIQETGRRLAAGIIPMGDPDQFWAWYHEHSDTVWERGFSGTRDQRELYRVAKVPQLRRSASTWGGTETWAWEFQLTQVGKDWSRDQLRYPDRLLAQERRVWTPVEPADDDLLARVLVAELALYGGEP